MEKKSRILWLYAAVIVVLLTAACVVLLPSSCTAQTPWGQLKAWGEKQVKELEGEVKAKVEEVTTSNSSSHSSSSSLSVDGVELPRLVTKRPEQIITHIGYTVSYNNRYRIPNWVAYELTAEEVAGDEGRSNDFEPDPMVRVDPVVTSDYTNSGYDRGHMAPAADMKWSKQAMKESFYMTNICPQIHNLNAGDWKTLEEKVRSWASDYSRVYVACGPIVKQGYGTIGGERRIAIPASFYKVILCEKRGKWQAIGFVMDNVAGHKALSTYVMSIDDIETLTGIDFFYNLPDNIEDVVEKSYSLSAWGL